ncbi:hypothetical protein L1049_026944 [Liquidambar formosana]|uniref:Cytochrome P450 n=1 Tax=Liquidambar formosana TaxID=63359 RepID=A0AAP0NI00_LIQFO
MATRVERKEITETQSPFWLLIYPSSHRFHSTLRIAAMELLLLPIQTTLLASFFTFLLFVYYLIWKPRQDGKSRTAPEAPGAWPIFGHLHQLGSSSTSQLPHAVLSGSTDTTTITLVWALSLLLNNRNALKKAQEELDFHIGKERQVEESDMENLVYLQAILKETLRLYPAAPLSGPHESMEDCIVGGYHVPKGTRLVVNIWKIHRDPRVWLDPYEFRPERFLTTHKDVDLRGQHFELIPFGSGRRMCPGLSLSVQVIQLTLASLLHGFDIATISNEPVDMRESFGLTILKATPLEVLLTPRLSSHLYR